MNHSRSVFYGEKLLAGCLMVCFRAAETRQNQSLLSGNQMAAIELGGYLDRQLATLKSFRGVIRIGSGRQEIPAESNEHLYFSLVHRFDGAYCVKSMLLRRAEVEFFS